MTRASQPSTRIPPLLVICAGLVIGMAMGARHVQGLFMLPLLADHGWRRSTFSLARALGIFGAPTFVVGNELFWGRDRFEEAFERQPQDPETSSRTHGTKGC